MRLTKPSQAWSWWPAGPGTDVGSRHRVRLVRRHCVYETSESCASLLGSAAANDTDFMV